VEFNIEGYPDESWLALVEQVRPAQATLVPDPPGALTSNAGWDLSRDRPELAAAIRRVQVAGCRASIFVDPAPGTVRRARAHGADRVELYTEPYAQAFTTPQRDAVFARYRAAAEAALEEGLGINAGHDLDLDNLPFLAQNLPGLAEVSIGHALISDALLIGLDAAVRAYLAALAPTGATR
jgi:pyridoxine 5-phosphate synthase